MSKGIDSAKALTSYGKALLADGITFVIGYYFAFSSFKDRLSLPQTSHFSSLGIYNLGIWEGAGDHAGYFTPQQGAMDGEHAAAQAKDAGQPLGTPIYFAADYDSEPAEIIPYATKFQDSVKAAGFVTGIYGNGITCQALKSAGIVSYTWLSQSTGFSGYEQWHPHANIVQGPEYTWAAPDGKSFDVDGDAANGDSGAWLVKN